MRLRLDRCASPLCPLLIVTDEDGVLRALEFGNLDTRLHRLLHVHYGSYTLDEGVAPASIIRSLDAYFHGDLTAVDELLTATGGTAFQREVWAALRRIPAGTTVSYGQLANQLGRPVSARAVGAANGANPVCIVVPCHRVIGANGTLTGFAGGVDRKRWLLDHESDVSNTRLFNTTAEAREGAMNRGK